MKHKIYRYSKKFFISYTFVIHTQLHYDYEPFVVHTAINACYKLRWCVSVGLNDFYNGNGHITQSWNFFPCYCAENRTETTTKHFIKDDENSERLIDTCYVCTTPTSINKGAGNVWTEAACYDQVNLTELDELTFIHKHTF